MIQLGYKCSEELSRFILKPLRRTDNLACCSIRPAARTIAEWLT